MARPVSHQTFQPSASSIAASFTTKGRSAFEQLDKSQAGEAKERLGQREVAMTTVQRQSAYVIVAGIVGGVLALIVCGGSVRQEPDQRRRR